MWIAFAVLPALADPASSNADDADVLAPDEATGPAPAPVVGGKPVRDGKWDDTVAVMSFGYAACTGTLIGPKVVLTAGHCTPEGGAYPISEVAIGTKNWISDPGERIGVVETITYPNSWNTYDIAILLLEEPSKTEPRPLAMDCVLDEYLEDGAPVQIVGFGNTREDGGGYNFELNEAASHVLDKNCNEPVINGIRSGCNESVMPGGEIAAGGDGSDACFGDSGGPLYLKTDEGDYLVGVTSRGFIGVDWQYPCRDGGIWVRPDAVLDWIEDEIGQREIAYPVCNDAPDLATDEIVTWVNVPGATRLAVNDPDGDGAQAVIEVVEPPEHGSVSLDGLDLVYEPDPDYVGSDSITFSITDAGTDYRRTGDPVTVEVTLPITVHEGSPPGECGCASGGAAGVAWLAPLAPILLRRRRRP